MKKLVTLLLFAASICCAQNAARWDSQATTVIGVGNQLPVVALPGATIAFYSCSGPAASSCTTLATTYTAASGGSACPTSAQVVVQGSNTCTSVADNQGNFGAWFVPGTTYGYAYTVTTQLATYGPYQFTVGLGEGGGAGTVTSVGIGTLSSFLTGSVSNPSTTPLINLSVGTVPVSNGGTGDTTLPAGQVLVGNGTGPIANVAPSTTVNGQSCSLGSSCTVPAGTTNNTVACSSSAAFSSTANTNTLNLTCNVSSSTIPNGTPGACTVVQVTQAGTFTLAWPPTMTNTFTPTTGTQSEQFCWDPLFNQWVGFGAYQAPLNAVNINQYSGTDLGTKYGSAQAANPTATAFAVTAPGAFTTSPTIASGTTLFIEAPITGVSAPIILASNSMVQCGGASAQISVTTANNLFQNSAAVNNSSSIRNCFANFSGSGANESFFYQANTQALNKFSMLGNNVLGGVGFSQIAGASVTWSQFEFNIFDGNSATTYGVVFNSGGTASYNVVSGNVFVNVANGWEDFGGFATSNPSYTAILSSGHAYNTVVGNTCYNVTACAWGGVFSHTMISGNTAFKCGDTCFDMEGTANSTMANNIANDCASFCFSTFAPSYFNGIIGNQSVQAAGTVLAVKNGTSNPAFVVNTQVLGNTFTCSGTAICSIDIEDSSQTSLIGNRFNNVNVNFGGELVPALTFQNNQIAYGNTFATASPGLGIPTTLFGEPDTITGNTIVGSGSEPAGSYCIAVMANDDNNSDDYYVQGNVCLNWPSGIEVTNNGTNGGLQVWAYINGNKGLASIVPTLNGTGTVPFASVWGNCTALAICPFSTNVFSLGGSQNLTGVQGTAGTKIAATSGTFTIGNLRSTNSTGDEVDSGLAVGNVCLSSGTNCPAGLTTPVSVANGGTGTSSPALNGGSGISITGSWPNQTITATGGGGGYVKGSVTINMTSASGTFYGSTTMSGVAAGTAVYMGLPDLAVNNGVTSSSTWHQICSTLGSGNISCAVTISGFTGAPGNVTFPLVAFP